MNYEPKNPARRPSGGRIATIVASGLVALMSLGFLTAGGLLLWADSQKDEHGYISSDNERFSTQTAALATENLDLDFDGLGSLIDEGTLGKIRVAAESNDGKPVFVGVARTDDVTRYLRGTAHDIVTDVDYSPFHADYNTQPGDPSASAPGAERFWAATAEGDGEQVLTWEVEDGDWSVVVMNADGSAGVDTGIEAGASLGFLDEAGWISLGTGLVLLALAGGLLFVGVRPRGGAPLGSTDQATVTVA
jgi:hypothetical protein